MPPPLSRLLSRGFKARVSPPREVLTNAPDAPTVLPINRARQSWGLDRDRSLSGVGGLPTPPTGKLARSKPYNDCAPFHRDGSSRLRFLWRTSPACLHAPRRAGMIILIIIPAHLPQFFYDRPVGQDAPPRWPLGARRAARGGGGGGGRRGRVRVRRGREGPGGGAGEDGQGEAAPGREDRAQVRPSSISSSSSSAQTSGPAAAAAAAALACCSCTQAADAVGPDAVAADAVAVPERTTRTDSAPGPGTEASV